MGAIASGGVTVGNDDMVRGLGTGPEAIQRVAEGKAASCCAGSRPTGAARPFPQLRARW
jgi:hypothetical protein